MLVCRTLSKTKVRNGFKWKLILSMGNEAQIGYTRRAVMPKIQGYSTKIKVIR
jgi:hypothetical protein